MKKLLLFFLLIPLTSYPRVPIQQLRKLYTAVFPQRQYSITSPQALFQKIRNTFLRQKPSLENNEMYQRTILSATEQLFEKAQRDYQRKFRKIKREFSEAHDAMGHIKYYEEMENDIRRAEMAEIQALNGKYYTEIRAINTLSVAYLNDELDDANLLEERII